MKLTGPSEDRVYQKFVRESPIVVREMQQQIWQQQREHKYQRELSNEDIVMAGTSDKRAAEM